MRSLMILLMISVLAGLLVAGCTTPSVQPAPTKTVTPPETTTSPAPVLDTGLVGTWTLGEMGLQGGEGLLTVFPTPITITFTNQGLLAGNGGCNNYQGSYVLTGNSTPFGKELVMGPVIATRMYCQGTSDTETTYFQILSNVTTYGIDNTSILSMRDPVGSTLVFQRS